MAAWLRWRRWHTQLEHCLNALISRANSPLEPASSAAQLREAERQALAAELDPQQREAVLALLQQRLVLLLGGPGTGKTSTVAAMLAAALSQQPNLRLQAGGSYRQGSGAPGGGHGGRGPVSSAGPALQHPAPSAGGHGRQPLPAQQAADHWSWICWSWMSCRWWTCH